ncbi:transposase [Streptosporangium lutulentum]|uniref:Transposase n=1 Tax=Streptosporangium lutulentum TaxID=1461250 RepID=A0ABT9QAB0_9ACTN|nr:transposase [Streptosporangium lutulentum]
MGRVSQGTIRKLPVEFGPERRDQPANRKREGGRGGRPHAFNAQTYKRRNLVERCFGKLKRIGNLL